MKRDMKEIEVKRADDLTGGGDRMSREGSNEGNKKGGVIIDIEIAAV